MRKHFLKIVGILAAIIMLCLVNFTTPATAGPAGVLLFFTTLYVLAFCSGVGVVRFFNLIIGKKNVSGRKVNAYAAVLAFAPLILLFMQSLGRVSLIGLVLALIFELLAGFLVSKRT